MPFVEGSHFQGFRFNIKDLTALAKADPQNKPGFAPDWGTEIFEQFSFQNLTFENCNFRWLNFVKANFKNVKFSNCNFEGALFDEAVLHNVEFISCELKDASFYLAKIENALFECVYAPCVSFMQTSLLNVVFKNNVLQGSNFLAANADSVQFEGDAENILFYETAQKFCLNEAINQPVVLIPWSNKKPGVAASKLVRKIQALGGIPLKFNYHDPEIDPIKLKAEIDDILAREKTDPVNAFKSLPKVIFAIASEGNYPEIENIQKKAHQWVKAVSGVIFTGGEDVQPFFYRQEPAPQTFLSEDFRRDLFEFAVHAELESTDCPVLGICRGMQVANIWRGGSLNQHVCGHRYLIQQYNLVDSFHDQPGGSVVANIFNRTAGPFCAYTSHHQSVKDVGDGLTVIAYADDGTIKAIEKLGEKFRVFVQWHPEHKGDFSTEESIQLEQKLSPGNHELFQLFIEATKRDHNRCE